MWSIPVSSGPVTNPSRDMDMSITTLVNGNLLVALASETILHPTSAETVVEAEII